MAITSKMCLRLSGLTLFLFAVSVSAQMVLDIQIDGRTQSLLTNPENHTAGVESTGHLAENIPNLLNTVSSNQTIFSIQSPAFGLYQLSIRGGYEEFLTVRAALSDGPNQSESSIYFLMHPGDTINVGVRAAGGPTVSFEPQIAALSHSALTFEGGNSGVLSWATSDSPGVVGYSVYGRSSSDTNFSVLADTAATTYDTGHELQNFGGSPWFFLVVPVRYDGREGAVGNILQNLIYPIAAWEPSVRSGTRPLSVSFTDLSTASPTSWAWDFDSDGTVDSTERNPTHIYAAAGMYTVQLTITTQLGTDSQVAVNQIEVLPVDTDGDGVDDLDDNCRSIANPLQEDANADGCGDACIKAGCGGPICVNN